MATGAILGEDIEEVVARTVEAVELVRVAALGTAGEDARLRELAAALEPGVSALVDDAAEAHPLPERFVLTAEPADVAERLRASGAPRALLVAGALPQRLLDALVPQVRRSRETLTVVVSDATRLFLTDRGVGHYARAGLELRVLRPIELLALTVNPVAPQSHSFESGRLRAALAEAIGDVPIFDVLHPSYAADGAMPARSGARPGAGRPG